MATSKRKRTGSSKKPAKTKASKTKKPVRGAAAQARPAKRTPRVQSQKKHSKPVKQPPKKPRPKKAAPTPKPVKQPPKKPRPKKAAPTPKPVKQPPKKPRPKKPRPKKTVPLKKPQPKKLQPKKLQTKRTPLKKKRSVKRKKPKQVRPPVFHPMGPTTPERQRVTPRIFQIEPGDSVVQREFNASKFINRGEFSKASEILLNVIDRVSAKKPLEAEDMVIYNYGLKILGPESITPILPKIAEILPKGVQIDYSDTRAGTEIYVRLNVNRQPLLYDQAADGLDKAGFQAFAGQLREILIDFWEDEFEWWVWFESDESLYE